MRRSAQYVPRHRGKSPHQIAFFSRSHRVQWETAQLASLLSLFNVVPPRPGTDIAAALPTVSRGEKLCSAFETYLTTIQSAQISFEHAVFLAVSLSRGDQLKLSGCRECGGLVVVERFPVRDRRCQYCSNTIQKK
jgi:hypothetical protein